MIVTLLSSLLTHLPLSPLEQAIWEVESSSHPGGIPYFGDSGKAAGPFQIHKNYWIDSRIGGTYPDDLFDLETSVKCFRGFMDRYAIPSRIPEGCTMSLDEVKARMHNGGPQALKATGKKKQNLDQFWDRVQKAKERNRLCTKKLPKSS